MMHALCYLSFAIPNLRKEELRDIVRMSILNNKRSRITGLLCYHDNKFIQFMEGDKNDVTRLYEKLKKDRRHSRLVLMLNQPIEHRMFRQWYMAIRNVDDFTGIAKAVMLELFEIDLTQQAQNQAKSIEILLDAFRHAAKENPNRSTSRSP